jgi:hypothetical protein
MHKERVRALIVASGADRHSHRRGTLLAHLERTTGWAERWHCPEDLVTAALCHAVYGTDGLVGPLVSLDERDRVRAVIGERAEHVVYRYASCDREFVYPQLEAAVAEVSFRDRFTGWTGTLPAAEWADFMTLTWANSADVIETSGNLDWSGALPFLEATASLVPDAACIDLYRLLNAGPPSETRAAR